MQDEKLAELTVQDVEAAYEIDSKGCRQPVYIFKVLYNYKEGQLVIPALKKQKYPLMKGGVLPCGYCENCEHAFT